MEKYGKNIIVQSEKEDINTNIFTGFNPYLSEFDWILIRQQFEDMKESSNSRKKYPDYYAEEDPWEVQKEERFTELMEKYMRFKDSEGPPLNEEEDKELLRLHNILLDYISSTKLNEERKRYRERLKLATEFKDQLEKEIIVFDDPGLEDLLPNTKEWINFLIKFLQHPSEVTEDDLDRYPLVEETMFIETIPSMEESYKAYKKATELPPMVKSLEKHRNSMSRILQSNTKGDKTSSTILQSQMRARKKVHEIFEENVVKEVAQELRTLLKQLECFSGTEKEEWKKAIERGERKNMQEELKEVLGIFRKKLQREQVKKEYVEESKECEKNIIQFGSKMREKIEEAVRDEELRRADEIKKAMEKNDEDR